MQRIFVWYHLFSTAVMALLFFKEYCKSTYCRQLHLLYSFSNTAYAKSGMQVSIAQGFRSPFFLSPAYIPV
jgi:hypothetical protein